MTAEQKESPTFWYALTYRRLPSGWTIEQQIVSPIPMPLGFVMQNGSKRRERVSGLSQAVS
jgi:hypothetical protein